MANANLYSAQFTAVNISLRSVNVIMIDVTTDTNTNGSNYSPIFSTQKYFNVQYILLATKVKVKLVF